MKNAKQRLNDERAMLAAVRARARTTPAESAAGAKQKLAELESLFVDASRNFDRLLDASEGTAEIKIALEKSLDAFRARMSSK